jgi:hypothetical protein
MLFTDGNPANSETLRTYEAALLSVAATEGIDLDAKLEIASEQIGDELEIWFKHTGTNPWIWTPPPLGSVFVSPALRRWHAFQTLETVYRDAYFQELNDRFKGKWRMYGELRREARDQCFAVGIGIVGSPIPKGPAPSSSLALGDSDGNPVYVQLTWVAASGVEGTPGDVGTFAVSAGSQLVVTITELAPMGCGWNVYAGATADQLTLQNNSPLGQSALWAQASPPRTDGAATGSGQTPDYYLVDYGRLQRG